jgi:DNA-binding transcriptional MocR family regulator
VRFFGNFRGIEDHMKKHAAILKPKFDAVISGLDSELSGTGLASWNSPNGGYFVSLNILDGCAKRTVKLCCEAGVKLTPAGATYPYGKDPRDRNIRIAPTFPPVAELKEAIALLCLSVKLSGVEKILESK